VEVCAGSAQAAAALAGWAVGSAAAGAQRLCCVAVEMRALLLGRLAFQPLHALHAQLLGGDAPPPALLVFSDTAVPLAELARWQRAAGRAVPAAVLPPRAVKSFGPSPLDKST
jgi:hypothetical protein